MRTAVRWGKHDYRPWTFVTPISNLVLGDAVDRELRVDRVLFVDRDKLPYIRKRLGFYSRVSKVDRTRGNSNFFRKASAYAIIRHKGSPSEVENACLKTIRDELAILNLSYLGYAKRKHVSFPALWGEHKIRSLEFVLVNREDSSGVSVRTSGTNHEGLFLDGRWALSQSARTFDKLTSILCSSVKVHPEWRKDLKRASVLVGEGLETEDKAMSFLRNMIALESLLTRRGDKVTDMLPTRARAFLGWVGFWEMDNYEQKIEDTYNKRNALVHSGDKGGVRPEDLIFTDDLLFNLITNLVSFPTLFGSKEKIVTFADKVETQHKSGQAEEVRPKGLVFTRRLYKSKDFENL